MSGFGGKHAYITRAGLEKLQSELKHLWNVERPKVTQEVAAAAAMGDRSENAEYIYGKRRLREIDRRVRYLSKRIEQLEVIEPGTTKTDRALFGAYVTVCDEQGEERRYRLVGPDETDPDAGQISVESPIGRALVGTREGDEVTVVRPKGELVLEVIRIEY